MKKKREKKHEQKPASLLPENVPLLHEKISLNPNPYPILHPDFLVKLHYIFGIFSRTFFHPFR
ncbi:hypothetical protein JMA_02100 [Jeotgalibacillus malaysiensis]|uniref:Uncharacterized protein n=1 Tax=Jeotgalibacillus malaysiensis TaxID=1508404 RepID=A0A0B5ALD5_9BACL|nr:hypothetical protein JMA_02100 [Jeotgalibacillus malaysiensis]